MNLKDTVLSNNSLTQKDNYYVIPLMRRTQSHQVHSNIKQNGGFQGLGDRKVGSWVV